MGSDVIFDNLYLDRCLRSGWYLDVVMLLLLGVASLMFRSDSVVFGLPGSCVWWWMIWWHLIFWLSHIRCHTRAYSVSGEDLHRVARSSPLARCTLRWWFICYFYDDPSVEPRPTFLDIWLLSCFLFWDMFPRCLDLIWIMEIACSMMDDSMSPDFWPIVHSMPYCGIFSSWMRVIDLHGVVWSPPLTGWSSRRWPVCYF